MDELLTDIALDGEDLAETPSGDLATVSGAANVTQAGMLRLIRAPGELVWALNYGAGLHLWLEGPRDPGTLRLAAQLCRRSLRADPRIASAEVTITPDPRDITAVVVEVTGRTTTGEAIFASRRFGG